MLLNELSPAALEAASAAIGNGPIVMVNFLWFRDEPQYPEGFEDAKATAREAYYEGYADAIRSVAADLGVSMDLIYAGERLHSLLAGQDGDWDDIVIVRYDSFEALTKIVESDAYRTLAQPHRLAGIANWRFFATRGK
jgi:uncharacterized protein (DUF1330 family)